MNIVPIDEVVHFDVITSNPSTGAVSDADSTPTFSVFEEDTDTPIVGPSNLTKRTSLTGDYRGSFTASAANGFEAGKCYIVVASATVSSVAGKAVAMHFRVGPAESQAGVPKADVSHIEGTDATDQIRSNVAAVEILARLVTMIEPASGSPNEFRFTADAVQRVQSVMGLAAANLDVQLAVLRADTDDIQARLPAALVGGRMDASVGAMQNNTLTAAALATDAVTEIQTGLATSTTLALVKEITDRLTTMLEAAPGSPAEFRFTADALARVLTVAGMAAGNLDAQLAAQLTAINTKASQSSVTTLAGYVDTEVASIKAVTDKLDTTLQAASGSPGDYEFSADALRRAPTGSGGGGSGLDAAGVRAAVGLAAANLDTQLAAIQSPVTHLATTIEPASGSPGDYRFTQDALEMAPAGTGGGGGGPSASAIAAAVWGEALPGSFGGGTAGNIVGTNVDAQVSTRASASALATVDDFIDTEVAAIKVVTDALWTLLEPAGASPGEYRLNADALRKILDAVPSAVQNADALLARDIGSGSNAGTLDERTVRSALRFLRNKWAISGTTMTVRKEDDSTTAWTAELTTTPSADPVTGIDPT